MRHGATVVGQHYAKFPQQAAGEIQGPNRFKVYRYKCIVHSRWESGQATFLKKVAPCIITFTYTSSPVISMLHFIYLWSQMSELGLTSHPNWPHSRTCWKTKVDMSIVYCPSPHGERSWMTPCPRFVEGSPSHVAHQLAGDVGHVSSTETLPPRPKRSPCVGAHRQHSSGLLHKPPRRSAFTLPVQAGAPDPWVVPGKLLSLRVVHIPVHLNMGADILSRQGPRPREWMLHPEVVKKIWRVFGQAQVDLFATQETAQCPFWYSLTLPAPWGLDAMVQTWTRFCLYAFPPIALLLGVLARVRWDEVSLLLVAPFWLGQIWFSDLISLLGSSP